MSEPVIRFCPLCGTPTEVKMQYGELRPTCPACGWVYYTDPKVAAAVVVEGENDTVLLTRRQYAPFQGMWTLPAGFMNAHEDPARAAERECLEETGLVVEVTRLINLITGREHPRGADIVIVYAARVTGGTLQAGDDADQVAFFARADLPPLAFRATRLALGITEPRPQDLESEPDSGAHSH